MKMLWLAVILGAIAFAEGGKVKAKISGAKWFRMSTLAENNPGRMDNKVLYPVQGSLVTISETEANDCYMKVIAHVSNDRPAGCEKINFPNGCNSLTKMTVIVGDTNCRHTISGELNGSDMTVTVNGESYTWGEFSSRRVSSADCPLEVQASKWGSSSKPQLYLKRRSGCPLQDVKFAYNWNQIIVSEDSALAASSGGAVGL